MGIEAKFTEEYFSQIFMLFAPKYNLVREIPIEQIREVYSDVSVLQDLLKWL